MENTSVWAGRWDEPEGDFVIDKGDKAKKGKARAPEQTFEEVKYIKHLIENGITIRVKLLDNEEVEGVIEYYDHNFIRVTRNGAPNLFIYKHDIKYLWEGAVA